MNRVDELKTFLLRRTQDGIALAFSGGVDSTLLLSILKELREESAFPLLALTMHSVFQAQGEIEDVKRLADEFKVELKIFECDPLSIPEIKYNPPDRCYRCKRSIFNTFLRSAREQGIHTLLDGTNADDLYVYRPGRKALVELGIISPLAELGFTKQEIRAQAKGRGLRCCSKPSMPCLATRFEYGALLDRERVEHVAKGEALIRRYVSETADVRLRVHKNIARIEVSPDAASSVWTHRAEIARKLRCLGFEFITLDLDGFRSGCFDKTTNTTMEV